MKGDVKKVIDRMEPGEAVAEMGEALQRLLPILDEEDRTRFVLNFESLLDAKRGFPCQTRRLRS